MSPLDLLRFDWSRVQGRLLLAALGDPGPADKRRWAVRAGVPLNHVLPTARECERLGALRIETRAEGLVLLVQPSEFWRVTPLVSPEEWAQAWGSCSQERLALVTEARSLSETLAAMLARPESGEPDGKELTGIRCALPTADRNPVGRPESGAGIVPDRSPDRDRLIDPEVLLSRVPDRDRDRGEPESGVVNREYLLVKLRRMPGLAGEVLRPQGGQQQRMQRMFWKLAAEEPDWLATTLGELADCTATRNKAAWFNIAATRRLAMREKEVRA